MGYATKEDIDELYGTDLLVRVADYNRDGTPDPEVIAKGLVGCRRGLQRLPVGPVHQCR